MSLLNDALRKKTGEDEIKEPGYLDRRNAAPRKVTGRNISRICGLPLLLAGLVFGVWYFWGSLSAQMDSPIVARSISKDIEINESDLLSETNKDDKQEVEPQSDMLKPKGEMTPLEEPVEIDTVKKAEAPAKRRLEKVSPPPKRKAEKKPSPVKKELPPKAQKTLKVQKASKAKDNALALHQEARFLQKAFRYHRQGKFNQAIRMYQQVLKVNPDHRDALFNLASAYIQLKAYSEAFPLLKKLRTYDDGNPEILLNLAIVEIGMGNSTEAIHLLDLAANQYREPKFEIYFHRAAALSRLGRLEEALLSYKKAEELNPKHPNLNFNLALLYDNLHQYNEAVNYYRAFVQYSDNLPRYEEKKIESRLRSLQAYLAGNRS
jgi:tetratricopeptide (TPR) repeat protein